MLRQTAPQGHQLPQEEVRTLQPVAPQEEDQVNGYSFACEE